jgi:RsiW-degrading membrane proteinase PrsW (M82 family)
MTGECMNRWRKLWVFVKLVAAFAACLAVAVQAFTYMLESPDAAQMHPLSIVVAGLIFGFFTYGILSLIERAVRVFLPRTDPVSSTVAAQPQTALEEETVLMEEEQPLAVSADDSTQQKNQ